MQRISAVGFKRILSVLLTTAAMSAGVAAASEDAQYFSGIVGQDGRGLILPQTLAGAGVWNFDYKFEVDSLGPLSVGASIDGGPAGDGTAPFARAEFDSVGARTFLAADDVVWGMTPYIGAGMTTEVSSGTFTGLRQLLPVEGNDVRFQGFAGVSFELFPGFSTGLEYSYEDNALEAVPGQGKEDQKIMMRLDLGFN